MIFDFSSLIQLHACVRVTDSISRTCRLAVPCMDLHVYAQRSGKEPSLYSAGALAVLR